MSTFLQILEASRVARGCKDFFSSDFAQHMDSIDPLQSFQSEFLFPTPPEGKRIVYLCGNSLGLQPKGMKKHVVTQLDKWADEGVEGHFAGDTPWLDIDDIVADSMSQLVGAIRSEVVMMNSLTCNLHLMMTAFYRPTASRYKILIERKAFPSDYHAVISQIQLHGRDPVDALLEVGPREGETVLRSEDIHTVLTEQGSSIALVLFSGVQYYTGQLFDIESITRAAHAQGCLVGFDLAHAVGNVPLQLHHWGCDFACWCTYKYMNCGPGSLGGCFVHERHGKQPTGADTSTTAVATSTTTSTSSSTTGSTSSSCGTYYGTPPVPLRLAGWWGHRREDRFLMEPQFIPCEGANGFRLSNPPVLLVACIRASLDLFDQAGMEALRKKSLLLTGYLEQLLQSELADEVHIFTPSDPEARGCQLSLSFRACMPSSLEMGSAAAGSDSSAAAAGQKDIDSILTALQSEGVMCDARKPNVIRIAPTPLYNSFRDVYDFVSILKTILLL